LIGTDTIRPRFVWGRALKGRSKGGRPPSAFPLALWARGGHSPHRSLPWGSDGDGKSVGDGGGGGGDKDRACGRALFDAVSPVGTGLERPQFFWASGLPSREIVPVPADRALRESVLQYLLLPNAMMIPIEGARACGGLGGPWVSPARARRRHRGGGFSCFFFSGPGGGGGLRCAKACFVRTILGKPGGKGGGGAGGGAGGGGGAPPLLLGGGKKQICRKGVFGPRAGGRSTDSLLFGRLLCDGDPIFGPRPHPDCLWEPFDRLARVFSRESRPIWGRGAGGKNKRPGADFSAGGEPGGGGGFWAWDHRAKRGRRAGGRSWERKKAPKAASVFVGTNRGTDFLPKKTRSGGGGGRAVLRTNNRVRGFCSEKRGGSGTFLPVGGAQKRKPWGGGGGGAGPIRVGGPGPTQTGAGAGRRPSRPVLPPPLGFRKFRGIGVIWGGPSNFRDVLFSRRGGFQFPLAIPLSKKAKRGKRWAQRGKAEPGTRGPAILFRGAGGGGGGASRCLWFFFLCLRPVFRKGLF